MENAGDSLTVINNWTKDKLELLDKYIHAYSTIMNKQEWLLSYSYIDAFACTGRYRDRDSQQYVDGSPIVALTCKPPFNEYWFIEMSPDKLTKLKERVGKNAPNSKINFRCGDANEIIRDEIVPGFNSRIHRGLVFLDPYGLEIDFDTVRSLAKARAFDVFVNFSTMGVTRNLERKRSPRENTKALLTRVMGDSKLVGELYLTQQNLFGEEGYTYRPKLEADKVASWYTARVKSLFEYVSEPVIMRNYQGSPLYVLFLASHYPLATNIINDIFDRYEKRKIQQAQWSEHNPFSQKSMW